MRQISIVVIVFEIIGGSLVEIGDAVVQFIGFFEIDLNISCVNDLFKFLLVKTDRFKFIALE